MTGQGQERQAAKMRGPDGLSPRTFRFDDDGIVPNNPDLPVVLVAGCLAPGASARAIMALLGSNGWGKAWHYTVFPYHHYHPDAHEVLAVASGRATLILGGEGGETVEVSQGDVVFLPAGTGHCRADADAAFAVCGAYPPGQEDVTILRATQGERPATVTGDIAALARPETDPVYGDDGPFIRSWG